MRKHKKLILIPVPLTVDYPYQVKELHNMVTPKIGEYVSERDAKYYARDNNVQLIIKQK